MSSETIRVALFACTYGEIDGVANTSRRFAEYAKQQGYPFLLVHAGASDEIVREGAATRVQLRRGWGTFPLDGHHEFDLLFLRHYWKMAGILRDFTPDFLHITGPSDVGILGALLSHNLGMPLAASWQTNLHEFARCRVSNLLSAWPAGASKKLAAAAEFLSFHAAARFYFVPRFIFTPNREIMEPLANAAGRPCFPMAHSVNTETFRPEFRDRSGVPFRIGYVGRLTAEKNVRFFARLERDLLAAGRRDFEIVFIGGGVEENWLRQNLRHAKFEGWLTGPELSRAYANMDAFVFPSETDTFGLAVLEALASGVPAIVSPSGGPKYTVEHGKSGFVANRFEDFAPRLATLMSEPQLLDRMRIEARQRALSMPSWNQVFTGMYQAYRSYLCARAESATQSIQLDEAVKIVRT